jgi:hypothetical protein
MPEGWTLVHERRVVAHEDKDSAFTDGFHWTIKGPGGERPPQADWPTDWRDQAIRYVIALVARRACVNDPKPRYAPASAVPSLRAMERPPLIAPEEWTEVPHHRPGLYRRKEA